jgi:uncharacterized protein (DUF342 family)
MRVLLDCKPVIGSLSQLLVQIESEIASLSIADPPKRRELENMLRQSFENGSQVTGKVLVKGKPPVQPQLGGIAWAADFFNHDLSTNEKTGFVQERLRTEDMMVKEGQLLARVIFPKEGKEGHDVYGKPISPEKPKQILIHAGANVQQDNESDSSCFYATVDGRIRWAANTLSVDEVDHILHSVDKESGRIESPGAVLIGGDVLAGSRIEARGDIEVKGTIETADIQTGGSLIVHGGITGTGKQKIKAAGGIYAKFMLGADVEAGENVTVESEIVQSTIKTRGSLIMPEGRLVGGTVTALGEIVVGQAGSDGLVPTTMVVGEDHNLAGELAAGKSRIARLRNDLKKINETVEPLMAREKALSPQQRETATELLAEAAEIERSIEEQSGLLEELREDSQARTKMRISILQRVYPETTLHIKKWSYVVKKETVGPLRADLMGRRIVLLPLR